MSSPLDKLIGNWVVSAQFPGMPEPVAGARTSFEWVLDGAFVLQRSEVDHPEAPHGLMLLAPQDGGGFTQHYFDSRGVVRVYDMTLDDTTWTLTRTTDDFTPCELGQRYTGTFNAEGNRIEGQWEFAHEPGRWELDFALVYQRA